MDMVIEDVSALNSFRNREVDLLLMQLKLLVQKLNADKITEEEYVRKRDVLLERIIEAC
jgi:hypothetical protein